MDAAGAGAPFTTFVRMGDRTGIDGKGRGSGRLIRAGSDLGFDSGEGEGEDPSEAGACDGDGEGGGLPATTLVNKSLTTGIEGRGMGRLRSAGLLLFFPSSFFAGGLDSSGLGDSDGGGLDASGDGAGGGLDFSGARPESTSPTTGMESSRPGSRTSRAATGNAFARRLWVKRIADLLVAATEETFAYSVACYVFEGVTYSARLDVRMLCQCGVATRSVCSLVVWMAFVAEFCDKHRTIF